MIYEIGFSFHIIIYYLLIDTSLVSFDDIPVKQSLFCLLMIHDIHVLRFFYS